MWKPELLSPAGSLDKLKVAVTYGADAVYLAGQKFGLRTAAENFTLDELEEGILFAHQRGVKVFVVLNGFLHDSDLEELPPFVHQITELKADAVIASDLGVIQTVAENSKIPIHLSTQASCLNRYSAQAWKKMGVQRLIFGREITIENAGKIKKETGLEVELFIHGSMCTAYSGNCTISNYTQGRDSNRGGCAQSCRFKYTVEFDSPKIPTEQKIVNDTAFLSSKDLNGLEQLGAFFEHKIDSLKIEGRMRSPLYAAMISRVYREAIDTYASAHTLPSGKISEWQKELELLPHRDYTDANLISPAGRSSIHDHPDDSRTEPHYLGYIRKVVENQYALVETKAHFTSQDPIEVISLQGPNFVLNLTPNFAPNLTPNSQSSISLFNSVGEPIEKVRPNTLIRIPYTPGLEQGQILRKQKWLCN